MNTDHKKPRILLCWDYSRAAWIQYFEKLNDSFEFIYLRYLEASEDLNPQTENKRIYYTDYSTPSQLLDEVKPEKVVFMGLDGLQTIALNVACKKRRIPTFFMVHAGVAIDVEDYSTLHIERRSLWKESFVKMKSWAFTLRFLLSVIKPQRIKTLIKLSRFQYEKTKVHPIIAQSRFVMPERMPDRYIVYSENDKVFYQTMDRATDEQFDIIGNLEVDKFFDAQHLLPPGHQDYFLYIETPVSVIDDYAFNSSILTKEEYNKLISGLNEYALLKQKKLVVKLHPYSYANTWLFEHANIEYVKDCQIEPLILQSAGVFFYNSSLCIPALVFKNCCMITIGKLDSFQESVSKINVCTILPHELLSSPQDLPDLFNVEFDAESKRNFIRYFVGGETDGKALSRLKSVLLR